MSYRVPGSLYYMKCRQVECPKKGQSLCFVKLKTTKTWKIENHLLFSRRKTTSSLSLHSRENNNNFSIAQAQRRWYRNGSKFKCFKTHGKSEQNIIHCHKIYFQIVILQQIIPLQPPLESTTTNTHERSLLRLFRRFASGRMYIYTYDMLRKSNSWALRRQFFWK